MEAQRRQSIRRKITLVVLLVTGVVLLLVSVALFAFQAWTIKRDFTNQITVTGEILASNVTAAAMFKDDERAEQVLAGLKVMPQIVFACLELNDGTQLAHFGTEDDRDELGKSPPKSVKIEGSRVLVAQPVMRDGVRHGTLYLRGDFSDTHAGLLRLYGGVFSITFAASLLLAWLLSHRFQGFVTTPILRLADTARRITLDKDFSVRATEAGDDEVSELTRAFNRMLAQIEFQNTALQGAQRELIETSRRAGMAEVATGVLHNVGNVLNSVNVSANTMSESVRTSRITELRKVIALLQEHEERLGEFLTADPRGRLVPELIARLADGISAENAALVVEAESLVSHVGHIREIVAMQQGVATVSGITEVVAVPDLVEDALKLMAASLARHHIEVVREFQETPRVTLDRHKALQILVNLIRNAKQAMAGKPGRLTIGIARSGLEKIRISVRDTGGGIEQENLTRIFSHGFTTKKDGHGFGLHSSANTAGEMNGTLTAHSDGPGRGASFTLELPIFPRETP